MKPIAIFRYVAHEGAGYLGEFLDARHIAWTLIAIDAGETVPSDASAYAGLVFMGGPMSVNDDLPWIPKILSLIHDAMALDLPVLGHCLGGQLISKALGAVVDENPYLEIGWGEVQIADNDVAREWFGDSKQFQAFHWHGETFTLPQGATLLLSSNACTHQAYSIGKHLALQCHLEMTRAMIANWCVIGAQEIARADSVYVQSAQQIQQHSTKNLANLQKIAQSVYTKWLSGALNSSTL
ncbi:MAG: type 1 glutamine amidotransferase [Gallionella sp.]